MNVRRRFNSQRDSGFAQRRMSGGLNRAGGIAGFVHLHPFFRARRRPRRHTFKYRDESPKGRPPLNAIINGREQRDGGANQISARMST
ncbi:hypothetical protein EYF80_003500 [Liparis tanakae]|uniref:Uncharacterized protein n=1 Tax=Liparis tanakae TaxID=230148 RepID=A0A4Z2J8U2_9TELE|nr:hypothetical protein EYF80_003500 [Liparis tanakae]